MKELVCTFLINEEHGMHILEQLKNWYEHFGGIKEVVCTFCINERTDMHILENWYAHLRVKKDLVNNAYFALMKGLVCIF